MNTLRNDKDITPLPLDLLTDHVNPNYSAVVTDEEREEFRKILEENAKKEGLNLQFAGAFRGPATTMCVVKLMGETTEKDLLARKYELQRLFRAQQSVTFVRDGENEGHYGIVVPNKTTEVVSLRKVLSDEAYRSAQGELPVALGKTLFGDILVEDLAELGNILVVGQSGSGKSVFIAQLLTQLFMRFSPERVKVLPIDVKGGVELGIFADAPHLLDRELIDSCNDLRKAFNIVRREAQTRLERLQAKGVNSVKEYNEIDGVNKLPYLLLVIDEATEILMQGGGIPSMLEETAECLHEKGKDLAMSMLFATQNPTRDVITPEIEKNIDTKVVFRIVDFENGLYVLKKKGAESLLGRGDGLFVRENGTVRFQCAIASVEDVDTVMDAFRTAEAEAEEKRQKNVPMIDVTEEEEIMWKVLRICVETGHVSLSYLQRKMRRGYNYIANVLEDLVMEGYLEKRKENGLMRPYLAISKEDFIKEWELRFGAYDKSDDADGEDE